MARASVLIVDGDAVFRSALHRQLERAGYRVASAGDGENGLQELELRPYDVVLADARVPGIDGIELVRRAKQLLEDTVCIVMTGYGSTERSIEALHAGAFWCVDKRYSRIDSFSALVERALGSEGREPRRERRPSVGSCGFANIVGESPALMSTLSVVRKVADTDATVLVLGESGVGKELIARALHYNGGRSAAPFVTMNCGAIPEELMESELFGHVRGAFTGAIRDREGRFSQANGGTLFLDEIGDMSPTLQIKLLRVLQEREFEPVGSTRTERVDVRIIAATNQDLENLIREGRFREDLFFRIAVVPIVVPPLRERRDDIALLVEKFLSEFAQIHGGSHFISDAAIKRLRDHSWPGNVRELRGVIERLVVLGNGEPIQEDDLFSLGDGVAAPISKSYPLPPEGLSLQETVESFERGLIEQALVQTGGNKNRAAQLLQVKRTTLVEKIRSKGIRMPDVVAKPGGSADGAATRGREAARSGP